MSLLLGTGKAQFFNNNGTFASGGMVYSYAAQTLTPIATYPDSVNAAAGTNPNANPVVLNSRGEANIVLQNATKLVLNDSVGNNIWTVDNIVSGNNGDIYDSNGKLLIHGIAANNATNYLQIANAATGVSPSMIVNGTDTNIGCQISSKGSGALYLDGGVNGTVDLGLTSTGGINLHRNVSMAGNATINGTVSTGVATVSGLVATGLIAGSNPSSTIIGEVLSSDSATSVTVSANTGTLLVSQAFTAGNWLVFGYFQALSLPTTPTNQAFAINTVTGTVAGTYTTVTINAGTIGMGGVVPFAVYNFTTPTTLYLNCSLSGTSGSGSARGRITGVRIS